MTPTEPPGRATTEEHAATAEEAAYLNDAFRREIAGQLIMVETGPWSLLLLSAALKLAARHPGIPAFERDALLSYAGTWAGFYDGTPAADLAASGALPYGVVTPPGGRG